MARRGVACWSRLLPLLFVCCVLPASRVNPAVRHRPQDFQTKAVFELVVTSSKILRTGTSTLVTESAFVTLRRALPPGNAEGLEIQFFTKPITDAARTDIESGGREMR